MTSQRMAVNMMLAGMLVLGAVLASSSATRADSVEERRAAIEKEKAWREELAKAQKQFDAYYRSEVARVSATSSPVDDIEFIQRLIRDGAARQVSDAFKAVIFDQAYEMGMKRPAGYALAIEAMKTYGRVIPEHKITAHEKAVLAGRKLYAIARSEDKEAAARKLFDQYMDWARAYEEQEDYVGAMRAVGMSGSIAGVAGNEYVEKMRARHADLEKRVKINTKLDLLRKRVQYSPQNTAAVEALVMMHMGEMDDPRGALAYLGYIKDAELQAMVRLANTPLAELKPDDAIKLAEWYQQLTDRREGDVAMRLLGRTYTYLQHAIKELKDVDPRKTQLATQVTAIERQLDRLVKAGFTGHGFYGHTPFKLAEHTRITGRERAHLRVQGDVLVVNTDKNAPIAYFDVETGQNFSWNISARFIKREGQNDGYTLAFPLSDSAVYLRFHPASPKDRARVDVTGDEKRLRGFSIGGGGTTENTVHDLRVSAVTIGPRIDVRVYVDGEQVAEWQGGVDQIQILDAGAMQRFKFPQIHFTRNEHIEFDTLTMRGDVRDIPDEKGDDDDRKKKRRR